MRIEAAAASALPLLLLGCADSSGSDADCQVRIAEIEEWEVDPGRVTDYPMRFQSDERLLTAPHYLFELDANDRVLKTSGTEQGRPVWYWTVSYDERGRRSRLDHRDGTVIEFRNQYDDAQRLSTIDVTPVAGGQGYVAGSYRYHYEGHGRLWSREEFDRGSDGTIDEEWRRIDGGSQVRFELYRNGSPSVDTVWTHAYEEGVPVRVERDRGFWAGQLADGTADIRYRWHYEGGRLTAFEADGTDSHDNPHVDGRADRRESFSAACAPVLARFPWLSHAPGPEDFAPIWRHPP
jgi:hypothetical protein